ncbi:pyridoxamine 5'-phosphate oxidase family protein [Streptomyces olivoreticuli]
MATTQRRGRRIMMTSTELNAFLTEQRTCRVATISRNSPHVTPLWFVWDGHALWLYSLVRSRRWAELRRDARMAAVIDDGRAYGELCGVELTGTAAFVGESPRTGRACPELDAPEALFAAKYFGLPAMPHDGRHAWLRLLPQTLASWDFRKLPHG